MTVMTAVIVGAVWLTVGLVVAVAIGRRIRRADIREGTLS